MFNIILFVLIVSNLISGAVCIREQHYGTATFNLGVFLILLVTLLITKINN